MTAGGRGFEPRITGSEPVALPLGQPPVKRSVMVGSEVVRADQTIAEPVFIGVLIRTSDWLIQSQRSTSQGDTERTLGNSRSGGGAGTPKPERSGRLSVSEGASEHVRQAEAGGWHAWTSEWHGFGPTREAALCQLVGFLELWRRLDERRRRAEGLSA